MTFGVNPRLPRYCQPVARITAIINMNPPMERRTMSGSRCISVTTPNGPPMAAAMIIGVISGQSALRISGMQPCNDAEMPANPMIATASTGPHRKISTGPQIRLAPKPVKPRSMAETTAKAAAMAML